MKSQYIQILKQAFSENLTERPLVWSRACKLGPSSPHTPPDVGRPARRVKLISNLPTLLFKVLALYAEQVEQFPRGSFCHLRENMNRYKRGKYPEIPSFFSLLTEVKVNLPKKQYFCHFNSNLFDLLQSRVFRLWLSRAPGNVYNVKSVSIRMASFVNIKTCYRFTKDVKEKGIPLALSALKFWN